MQYRRVTDVTKIARHATLCRTRNKRCRRLQFATAASVAAAAAQMVVGSAGSLLHPPACDSYTRIFRSARDTVKSNDNDRCWHNYRKLPKTAENYRNLLKTTENLPKTYRKLSNNSGKGFRVKAKGYLTVSG